MNNLNKSGGSPNNIYSKVQMKQSPKFVKRPQQSIDKKINTLVESDIIQKEFEISPVHQQSQSSSINVCEDDKTSKSLVSRQATPLPLETMLGLPKFVKDLTFTPRFTDEVGTFFEKYQKGIQSTQKPSQVVSQNQSLNLYEKPVELAAEDIFSEKEHKNEFTQGVESIQKEKQDDINFDLNGKSSINFAVPDDISLGDHSPIMSKNQVKVKKLQFRDQDEINKSADISKSEEFLTDQNTHQNQPNNSDDDVVINSPKSCDLANNFKANLLKNYFNNLGKTVLNQSKQTDNNDKSELQDPLNQDISRKNTQRNLPKFSIRSASLSSFSKGPTIKDGTRLQVPMGNSASISYEQSSSIVSSYCLSENSNQSQEDIEPKERNRKGSQFLKSGMFFQGHLQNINKNVMQHGIKDKFMESVQKINKEKKEKIVRKQTMMTNKLQNDIGKKFKFQAQKRKSVLESNSFEAKSNWGFIDIEKVAQMEHSAAQRFISYKEHFINLTIRDQVKTGYDVISIVITHDASKAIVILKKINTEYIVRQYILQDSQISQEFVIKGDLIKLLEVVQDSDGKTFCLPYYDLGIFKLRIFDSQNDNIQELQDINEQLGITNLACPPQGSNIPSINAIFQEKGLLFVNLFDESETTNWHFVFDYYHNKVSQAIQTNMKCSRQNFPIGCFLNEESNEIYVIYRHGQFLTFQDQSFTNQNTDVAESKVKNLNIQKARPKTPHEHEHNHAQKSCPNKALMFDNSLKTYSNVTIQQLVSTGLEQMNLFENNILIAMHSAEILFFKRCSVRSLNSCLIHDDEDDDESQQYWKIYHTLNHQGQIFHTKGQEFLTVTTNLKIYFYKFNKETWLPELDSVMFNFMACNKMISGPNINISYQISQENFVIYKRKYLHKYLIKINNTLRKNCLGLTFQKNNSYCISDSQNISFYDQETYQIYLKVSAKELSKNTSMRQLNQDSIRELQKIMQNGEESGSQRSPRLKTSSSSALSNNQSILNMKSSPDESRLVLMIGHLADKGANKLFRISIYSLDHQNSRVQSVKPLYDNVLPDDMKDISTEFEFCTNEDQNPFEESQFIFLIDEYNIYKYNYANQTICSYFKFSSELFCQPDYLVFNENQQLAFVSCRSYDSIFIDSQSKQEIDFDVKCKVNEVQACKFYNGKFYILANRVDRQRGVFLMEIDQKDVSSTGMLQDKLNFLIFQSNKLQISGAELYFLEENTGSNNSDSEKSSKSESRSSNDKRTQLVVCYKSIIVNTLTVIVIALDGENSNIILKHDSFHIWESYFKGYLLSSHYFLILTNEGISLLNLQRGQESQKLIQDCDQKNVIVHSIQECDYLKIRATNHLHITYSLDQTKVSIKILDSFKSLKKQDAEIVEVYSILLEQLNLQQLLLLQGLFSCSSQSQIAKLIEQQPNPNVFYKSFLEIDMTNMISILSFDSRSIVALLDQKHSTRFSKEHPMFYKFKQTPEQLEEDEFKSAFDIALDNNQIQALNVMLRYAVEYQNSYHHAYLFQRNFTILLVKEINVVPLLNSNILYQSFDYDDWPQTHTDDDRQIKPYNDSIFKVGQLYSKVFKELAEDEPNQEIARRSISQKVHKIKYSLNLLTSTRNDEYSLMDLLASTDQIEVFDTLPVQDLIEFKWRAYSQNFHFVFAIIHMIYLLTFILYVNFIYINRELDFKIYFIVMMVSCNSVAMIYDVTQLYRSGIIEYYGDVWNYIDVAHIYGGFVNLYIQFKAETNEDIVSQKAKIFMILATMLMLFKTFFYLRIFQSLTQFVIMVGRVVTDMKEFIFFYTLFVLMFSIILGVLGLGSVETYEGFGNTFKKNYSTVLYENIPGMVANFLLIFRQSLCDFDMTAMMIPQFSTFESYLFWFTFMIIVLITNIVFLNFIIAEVSNSYGRVQQYVSQLILQERASLIYESEQMLDKRLEENNNLFPNFLILRQVEE